MLAAQAGQAIDLVGLQLLFDPQPVAFEHPRCIELREALPCIALGKVQQAQLAASLQAYPLAAV